MQLIQAAEEIGKLPELKLRILALSPTDAHERYSQAALLFLVELARHSTSDAKSALDEIISLTPELDRNSREFRWPAYLLLRSALFHAELRRPVSEFFFSILTDLGSYSPDPEIEVLNDHLRMLQSLGTDLELRASNQSDVASDDDRVRLREQWNTFSYFDANSLASGRPVSLWSAETGLATKLVGHEFDFLSFATPLRGDFEIECDFTSAYGRNMAFMLAGQHLQLRHDGKSLLTGNARKYVQTSPLLAPLTAPEAWSRYRATMRDGVLTQFINGEPVLTRKLAENHAPWFSIRTWRRSVCSIRDLRITGHPEIPEEVSLVSSPDLDGWSPYFEEWIGSAGNWSGVESDAGEVEIRGRVRPELRGMAVEKLLRYFRPLLESGELSYEFFYSAESAAVHPALDEQAFVFTPSGVGVHQITHRRFERSGRDPVNLSIDQRAQRGDDKLPLLEDSWNRVTLTLDAESVGIDLNGSRVFQHQLDRQQQRSFGFFHYADLTEARIRNVVWKGDWPRELPKLVNQPLVDRSLDVLESRTSKLQVAFRHDFRDGAPDDLFDFQNSDSAELEDKGNGVFISQSSRGGNPDLFLRMQLHGDFDIVATFDELEVKMPQPRWTAGIGLRVTFGNDLKHRCALFRSTARNASNRRVQFYESSFRRDGTRRHSGTYLVEESRSGRMRVVRLGKTLYGMYASGDSPHYRLIAQRETTATATVLNGLSLALEGPSTSEVSALWKTLEIRAERITKGTP